MKPTDKKQVRRKRDPSRTRLALLKAGLELFSTHGFAGSTIEKIAQRAKVNKALISYYFGGKQGLQDAIHLETFRLFDPRMSMLPSRDGTAVEDLHAFIGAFIGLAESDSDYPVMLLRGLISGESDPDGIFPTRALELNRVLREILEKGYRAGQFRKADPLLTQVSILGSLLFFFATAASRRRMFEAGRFESEPPTTEQYIGHLQVLVMHGLIATPVV